MMKKLIMTAGAAAMVAWSSAATAGFYLHGGAGNLQYGYSNLESTSAFTFGAGYQINDVVGIEVTRYQGGKADFDDAAGTELYDPALPIGTVLNRATMKTSATSVTATFRSGFTNDTSGWALIGRAGLYNGKQEMAFSATVPGVGTVDAGHSESGTGFTVGIGVEWAPVPSFGIRLNFDGLLSMDDGDQDENVNVLSLGVAYRFGTGK